MQHNVTFTKLDNNVLPKRQLFVHQIDSLDGEDDYSNDDALAEGMILTADEVEAGSDQ